MDWKLLIYLVSFVALGGGVLKLGTHFGVMMVKKEKMWWAGFIILSASVITTGLMVFLEKWIY